MPRVSANHAGPLALAAPAHCDPKTTAAAAGAPPLSPCFVRYRPLDLGEAHYPHSLNVAVCVQSPHCRTNYYHVPVLTYKGKQSSNHSTLLLPKDLRKHWRFEFKSVPVACECLRSSYGHG